MRTPHIENRVMRNGLLVSPAPRSAPEKTIASICGTWIRARMRSSCPPSSMTAASGVKIEMMPSEKIKRKMLMMNMTTDPMMPDRRTYLRASGTLSAPSDCPTRVVTAVPNAKPGMKLSDSAWPASEFAAREMVPSEAMIDEVMTKAPEVVKRSNITGKLTRKTS